MISGYYECCTADTKLHQFVCQLPNEVVSVVADAHGRYPDVRDQVQKGITYCCHNENDTQNQLHSGLTSDKKMVSV